MVKLKFSKFSLEYLVFVKDRTRSNTQFNFWISYLFLFTEVKIVAFLPYHLVILSPNSNRKPNYSHFSIALLFLRKESKGNQLLESFQGLSVSIGNFHDTVCSQ